MISLEKVENEFWELKWFKVIKEMGFEIETIKGKDEFQAEIIGRIIRAPKDIKYFTI